MPGCDAHKGVQDSRVARGPCVNAALLAGLRRLEGLVPPNLIMAWSRPTRTPLEKPRRGDVAPDEAWFGRRLVTTSEGGDPPARRARKR